MGSRAKETLSKDVGCHAMSLLFIRSRLFMLANIRAFLRPNKLANKSNNNKRAVYRPLTYTRATSITHTEILQTFFCTLLRSGLCMKLHIIAQVCMHVHISHMYTEYDSSDILINCCCPFKIYRIYSSFSYSYAGHVGRPPSLRSATAQSQRRSL